MKKFSVLLFLALILSLYSNAETNSKNLNPAPLKKSELEQLHVPYYGMFIDGMKWKDTKGNHVVFYTTTGLYESREEDPGDGISSEIYAYYYTYKDNPNHTKRVWSFHETELNCPLATLLEFIDDSFRVTDLNNDGTAEIWLVYRGGCMGDITPWPMSIVMYDGIKEYKMSGDVKIILGGGEEAGGEYQFDKQFQSAPDTFRKYASELWKHYCFYYDYSKGE